MSDTIIVYENGKAIGGEGHPTNADEITFNNEDTDLVSEEVESAIKEVNAKFDRGSVSVTADGTKTFGTLLAELFALVDTSKITHNSLIIETRYSGTVGNHAVVYELEHIGGIISYSNIEVSTSVYVNTIRYTQSTSAILCEGAVISAPSTISIGSNASSVPSANQTITLYY